MQPRSFLALMVGLALTGTTPAQNYVAQADQDVTLRISVNLVQVDAVVVDSKGKHVADLKPEDFEVTQDGKPQKITHFSYIVTTVQPAQPKQPVVRTAKGVVAAPPPPPKQLKPSDVRRTMAFVVDDLGLSFESIAYVRSSLKKFVETQMQPGDMVAIVRTGAGMGALQSFSSEKRVLLAAVDRVKWNPMGRVGVSSFRPMGDESGGSLGETEFNERVYSVGTLGAVSYLVNGLKELPGRKSVLLFSEHMRMFNRDGSSDQVKDSMQRLTDQANRASVVIYTIDPRGLPTLSLTAADKPSDPTRPDRMAEQMSARTQEHWESQEGLHFLAEQTGGTFAYNTNDISGSINKVLQDQSGYYLIGWNPGSGVFDSKRAAELYHRIKIRVKLPGLQVRTRNGFYGTPDQGAKPQYQTRDEKLFAALQSPFGSGDVALRLTALFSAPSEKVLQEASARQKKELAKNPPPKAAPKKGKQVKETNPAIINPKVLMYVNSLLHISGKDLTFVETTETNSQGKEEAWQKAVIDVLMITFGEKGEEVDRSNATYTVKVKGETYKRVVQSGFIYTMNHPIKKAGAYQLRAAVRDANSGKAGSATQFIEVPDVGKGKLALSGIVLKEKDPAIMALARSGAAPTPGAPQQTAAGGQKSADEDPDGGPALRVFKPGKLLTYGLQVINAKESGNTVNVDTQVRVFRDGKDIYDGKPLPVQTQEQKDLKRLVTGGILTLKNNMEPGDYVLQVVAKDKLSGATASQWIDFEVAGPKKQ